MGISLSKPVAGAAPAATPTVQASIEQQIKQLSTKGPDFIAPLARMTRTKERNDQIALAGAIRRNNAEVRDALLLRSERPVNPTAKFKETGLRRGAKYTTAADVATERGVDPSHLKMMLDHGLVPINHMRPAQSDSSPHTIDGESLFVAAERVGNVGVVSMLFGWTPSSVPSDTGIAVAPAPAIEPAPERPASIASIQVAPVAQAGLPQ